VGVPSQYSAINSLLRDDLAPIIEDRNKLAHAQWRWLLNSRETAFTGPAAAALNYLALQRRGAVITHLAALIHALVVSEPTFHRDYSFLYNAISQARATIDGPDYPSLVIFLRSRRRSV
jgi:hypothetical protein